MRRVVAASFSARRVARREYSRRFCVVSEAELHRVLAGWTCPTGQVMVHSALSACGHIEGGADTVIGVLRSWVGGGLLAMPTHSYCYTEPSGVTPLFDPARTESVVGAITNRFWKMPDVRRSLHPTHSLACAGVLAADYCEGHERLPTPCGEGTPYARLIAARASVLMFGASLDSYTFFHTAEDAAGVPYLYEKEPYTLRLLSPDGTEMTVRMWRQEMGHVPRCFGAMHSWLESRCLLQRRRVGLGEFLFIPDSMAAHEAVVAQLRADPLFLVEPRHRGAVTDRAATACRPGFGFSLGATA
jgi:aminoglycoside 3-N-acetyltransferase